jgi:putative endonuclease
MPCTGAKRLVQGLFYKCGWDEKLFVVLLFEQKNIKLFAGANWLGACPAPERSDWCGGKKNLQDFYYTYVLLSQKDNHFYIGFTNDLDRRLNEHQHGKNISTSKRLPVSLIYFEGHRSKEDALRRESYFKTTKEKTTLKQIL